MARYWVQKINDGRGPYRQIPVILVGGALCAASIYEKTGHELSEPQAAELMALCVENAWTWGVAA